MSVLFVTLPLALLLGGIGLYACIRCIRSGQYDDLDADALRILQDEIPHEERTTLKETRR